MLFYTKTIHFYDHFVPVWGASKDPAGGGGTKYTLKWSIHVVIVSPVRSTYGGYYGLVVVTPPRPHFIVYAIT